MKVSTGQARFGTNGGQGGSIWPMPGVSLHLEKASSCPRPHSARLLFGAMGIADWPCRPTGAIVLMPQPPGLSIAGQHMLGVFAFAVIVWVTEAVEYAASSVILLAMMGILRNRARPRAARPSPWRHGGLIGGDGRLYQSGRGTDRCFAGHCCSHGYNRPRQAHCLWGHFACRHRP
jgi:hypothetical protein